MRKIILIAIVTFIFANSYSQSIGIGTNSPNSSSLLDISSISKGMLMPRMTSAQRTAIVSPATGLLVFDTDTKTLWAYDAVAWKNLYTSGGGFVLPFSQTINIASSAFQVTTQGTGAAIDGISTAEFGTAMTAKTTGVGGWGLFAYSNRPSAVSINAFADSGTVFHGENNYPLNNSTLMSLLNRGVAKTTTFQLSNSSSASANVQIAGNNLAEQLVVFQTNASNSSPAVSINNSGTGAGLYTIANNGTGISGNSTSGMGINGTSTSHIGVSGVSSTNYGVKGVTNTSTGFAGVYGQNTGTSGSGVIGVSDAINTQGVYGSSSNGIGVRAFSNIYRALQGISTSGTGVYASSTSGLALETVGNIKISGGNTNPSAGAVLTSDASGNAVWKRNKIGFKAEKIHVDPYNIVPSNSEWKVMFADELHDFGGNFEPFISGTPGPNSATFIAPVSGLYHFDIMIEFKGGPGSDIEESHIILRKQQGNIITDIAKCKATIAYESSLLDFAHYQISTDVSLQANDKLWVIIYYDDDLGNDGVLKEEEFSGHLVFEN